MELIINKKGMRLPHVSSIKKKSVLKLLDRTVYAQVVQGQTEIPQANVTQLNPTNMTQPADDLTEPKQITKNLIDQMDTVINLISTLAIKNN
jgi:chemotaxis protein CheY-P-specific phosphatase CheC